MREFLIALGIMFVAIFIAKLMEPILAVAVIVFCVKLMSSVYTPR